VLIFQAAVRRVKFHDKILGFDVSIATFGDPIAVSVVFPMGPAEYNGVEV